MRLYCRGWGSFLLAKVVVVGSAREMMVLRRMVFGIVGVLVRGLRLSVKVLVGEVVRLNPMV